MCILILFLRRVHLALAVLKAVRGGSAPIVIPEAASPHMGEWYVTHHLPQSDPEPKTPVVFYALPAAGRVWLTMGPKSHWAPKGKRPVALPTMGKYRQEAKSLPISNTREFSYSKTKTVGKRARFDGLKAETQYKHGATEPRYKDLRIPRRLARPWAFEE
jgi:hypothetical protein